MRIFVFLLIFLTSSQIWSQQKIEEIEQYEIRSYDPQQRGLSDLVFEARIDNLTEILNKAQTFGKLIDVYFKVYWIAPTQYKIEVMGMPKGFQEVRDDLTSLIKGKLEFVIPEKFSERFKAYTLKSEPIADGKLIKAIDDTYNMTASEINIIFDKNSRLKTIESKAPLSNVLTEFFHSPKAWSNNKLVLDKVVSSSKQGTTVLTTINSVEYIVVAGMGFPSKISVKNSQEVLVPATAKEKEKKVKTDSGSIIKFSKYEVNTGKAQRYMVEGLKR